MATRSTAQDLAPLWQVGETLYREGATPSDRTRWSIWAAAGLPPAPPEPGRRAAKRHAEAVDRAVRLVDDAARLTEMTTEERNSPERQAELEAQLALFWDARTALRAMLGWPAHGRPTA